VGIEAGIQAAQMGERTNQQSGAHQQHHAQRHLTGHQQAARPGIASAGHAAASLAQRRADFQAAGYQRGVQAEQDAGRDRYASRGGQRAPVEFHGLPYVQTILRQGLEGLHSKPS